MLIEAELGQLLALLARHDAPEHARVLFVQRPSEKPQVVAHLDSTKTKHNQNEFFPSLPFPPVSMEFHFPTLDYWTSYKISNSFIKGNLFVT